MEFEQIDDILWDSESVETNVIEEVMFAEPVNRIGPLVEYSYIQSSLEDSLPAFVPAHPTKITNEFFRIQGYSKFDDVCPNTSTDADDAEFHPTPTCAAEFTSPSWRGFRRRLQDAAESTGFGKTVAQGLTGAVDEIVSNIIEHSQAPTSGLAGYHWNESEFEFVIADAGEGVLKSLQRNPTYSDLIAADEALHLALTDGVSRHGKHLSRGYGFRQLFVSLASLGARLRFRSGPYRLEIVGETPTMSHARIAPSPQFCGFLSSVICNR